MGFMFAALDESADRDRKHVFVVAGYLARQRNWIEIERRWTLRLEQESDPQPMKYFSRSECSFLSGEFSRFRDEKKYPKPKGRLAAERIKADLLGILKDAHAAGFALGTPLRDYAAIRKSSAARRVLDADPYVQSYATVMIFIASQLEEEMPSREVVAFLCDGHDKSTNVQSIYDKLISHNPICGRWMGSLTYADNESSPALQAADLLAGECKDFLVEYTNSDRSKLRDAFKSRVGGNVSIKYLDKDSLKLMVNANVLKDGRPGIYSTLQLGLFGDKFGL